MSPVVLVHAFGSSSRAWAAQVVGLSDHHRVLAEDLLPVLALRRMTRATWSRVVWVLGWVAAIFLTLYGLAQTAAAQLVYAGRRCGGER